MSALTIKPGESIVYEAKKLALVEPKVSGGHWQGGSRGLSVPLGTTGLRARIGHSTGHYVKGTERLTPIDHGFVTITNQRVVFQGTRQVREWPFTKMLGVIHAKDAHLTLFQVSGRDKSSGIEYPRSQERAFRKALHSAVEIFDSPSAQSPPGQEDSPSGAPSPGLGRRAASIGARGIAASARGLASASKAGIEKAREARSTSLDRPAPPESVVADARGSWNPDPSGQHELRWWDGQRWTGYVSDGGKVSTAPPD